MRDDDTRDDETTRTGWCGWCARDILLDVRTYEDLQHERGQPVTCCEDPACRALDRAEP